jgi:hypothetical protein
MGHNRAGVRRKARLKRRRRELERVAEKAAHAGEGGAPAVKDAAKGPPHGGPAKKGPAPQEKPS